MTGIRLEALRKVYPNGQLALAGIDLEVRAGEFLVLVGPSGCGKSTALRVVAGLETPTAGRVWMGESDVTGLAPQERDLAMVFQSYALYPHKSVRENLGFGLRVRGVDRREAERRVGRAAERLGLSEVLDRRPAQLSGGQRQRVALGRALVREPRAFLLDEPLSNLDAKLRVETRAELARLHRELQTTILYVTHDQEEAMTLGDRIAVMREGRLEQVGAPLDVYRRPASVFAAEFVGSPSINWFHGQLSDEGGRRRVRCAHFALDVLSATGGDAPRDVQVGIRPHDVQIVDPSAGTSRARVEVVQVLGGTRAVHARLLGEPGDPVVAVDSGDRAICVGDEIGVCLLPEHAHVFDLRSGRRLEEAA